MDDIDGDVLWRFSLDFYARPDIAPALIRLQDSAGCSVNLILYAIWHGLSGRGRLDAARLATAQAAIAPVETRVVAPLRRLRRALKPAPDADLQALRSQIQTLELAAEKTAQTRLAALAAVPCSAAGPRERRAAAKANLALYLGSEHGARDDAAALRRTIAEFAGG